MLRIIFSYTTNSSYIIHFFNKEEISDIRLKEKIEVFSYSQKFFRYLKSSKYFDKKIPLPYFVITYELKLKISKIMEKKKKPNCSKRILNFIIYFIFWLNYLFFQLFNIYLFNLIYYLLVKNN